MDINPTCLIKNPAIEHKTSSICWFPNSKWIPSDWAVGIKEAVGTGAILPYDEAAAPKQMRYIPWWARSSAT